MSAATPTSVLDLFRQGVAMQVHFWALVFVAPFIYLQYQLGHWLMVVIMAALCLLIVATLFHLKAKGKVLFEGRAFALTSIVAGLYSLSINEHNGLYWIYPTICFLFLLLRPQEAVAFSLLTMVGTIILAFQVFPRPEFWRIAATVTLTTVVMAVFSTLLRTMNSALTRMATIDPLTDCLNRSQLEESLNGSISHRDRYQHVASLVLLDLDFFKKLNDAHGHQAGDEVLSELAVLLRSRVRQGDLVFRIGGEEFLVLLPMADECRATAVAQNLLQAIAEHAFLGRLELTASAGVAQLHDDDSWSQWLKRADDALYRAKDGGRNRLAIDSVAAEPVDAIASGI